jgi:hypothetical protein
VIDHAEPLSFVIWAIFAFAAGLYPLGFMMGSSCSPCCPPPCGDFFEFKRCARFEAVTRGTRSASYTRGDPTKLKYLNGWPAIPTPTHGFSRSIARPEDIGVFRVADTAVFSSSFLLQFSQFDSAGTLVVRFSLFDGSGKDFLEAIYTFNIELSNAVNSVTYTPTSTRATKILVPTARLVSEDILLSLVTPAPVSRTVFRDYRKSDEGVGTHTDWTDFVFQEWGAFLTKDAVVKATPKTFAYACKLDDFGAAQQPDPASPIVYSQSQYVWDKAEVLTFLNGDSTQRYIDPWGKQWDVKIQGDTPLCGIHYSESIAGVDFPYLLTANMPAADCATRKAKFDLIGCADQVEIGFRSKQKHDALYRKHSIFNKFWGGNLYFGSINQIALEELKRIAPFPYSPELPVASQSVRVQPSICYFEATQTGCSVPTFDPIPSEAFFCGDLLWVLENGPCYTTLTRNDTDNRTIVYTLNTSGESEATEATRHWCQHYRETAHLSGVYEVYDYKTRYDDTCWPTTGKVHFPATWFPTDVVNTISTTAPIVAYLSEYSGTSNSGPYFYASNGEAGWQQYTEMEVNLREAYCETALYETRNASPYFQGGINVSRKCDGTFQIEGLRTWPAGWIKFSETNWLDDTWGGLSGPFVAYALNKHPDARLGRNIYNDPNWTGAPSMFSFTASGSGSDPVRPVIGSVSATTLPAEGGTVTVTTSGNGVGDRTSTVTIGRNSMRFSRTIFVKPKWKKRKNGTPLDSPEYLDDNDDFDSVFYENKLAVSPPFVRLTQKGYGGDEDTKCHVGVVWIGGVSEVNWFSGRSQNVTSDFTKVSCLVGQPAVVEGATCNWTVSSDNEYVIAKKEDGLIKVTVGPGALAASSTGYSGYTRIKAISARITVSTPLEDNSWFVSIKLADA